MNENKDVFAILHELQKRAEKKRHSYEVALADYQSLLLSINELLQEINNKNSFNKKEKENIKIIKNIKNEKNTDNKKSDKVNFIIDLLQKDRKYIRATVTDYPFGAKGLKITEINKLCNNSDKKFDISMEELKKILYDLLYKKEIERNDEGRYIYSG